MTADLEKIRQDAQRVQHCLNADAVPAGQHLSDCVTVCSWARVDPRSLPAELELLRLEKQQSHDQLREAQKVL